MLSENDKAAIAAGRWEPCPNPQWKVVEMGYFECTTCHRREPEWKDVHRPAPNMKLPENLWRALESRNADIVPGFTINGGEGTWSVQMYLGHSVQLEEGKLGAHLIEVERPLLADALFAALVALYDAEHPDGQ